MVKTVGIYKDIKDPDAFEKYYIQNVMPRLLQHPGVIRMRITSLRNAVNPQQEDFEGIQLIIETYYQSHEVLEELMNSPEGEEIIRLITNNPNGKLGSFFGKEKIFSLPKKFD